MTEATAKSEKKPTVYRLAPPDLRPSEQMYRTYFCQPVEGVTVADILNPEYWSNVSAMFNKNPDPNIQANDLIDVSFKDGSRRLLLQVDEVGPQWAKVTPLWNVDLVAARKAKQDVAAKPSGENYRVEFKGPQKKWCVISKDKGEYLTEKLESKDKAQEWLDQQLKAMAA